jgi:hypothetical protein
VIAFTGLVMGGSWVYRLYYPIDPTKPKSTDPKPSQEVLLLMMMFSSSMPLVVSGHLVRLSISHSFVIDAKCRSAYHSDSTTPEPSDQIPYPYHP